MALIERRCDVDEPHSGRVDRVVQELTSFSRAEVRGLFDHDCVQVNGALCQEAGRVVSAGDVVQVSYDPHRRYRERPRVHEERAFRLVFEDEYLLVVDKSHLVLTVPTEHGEINTLVDAVSRYLGQRRHNAQAIVVHRLDRGTSGLLVFGKNQQIADSLQSQFRSRKPERLYVALVAGTLATAEGTFESRLTTNKALQRHSTVRPDDGEHAITHFRSVQVAHRATLVHAWLETGRRNQIRVHFAEAGHPVLGDPRYQPQLAKHHRWKTNRLALHASILGFEHPVTGSALRFESPLPPEFGYFLGKSK